MIRSRFRTHKLDRFRAKRVSDGAGGWVADMRLVDQVVGSLQPRRAGEGEAGDQERAVGDVVLYLDPGSGMRRDDELVLVAVKATVGVGFTAVAGGARHRVLSVRRQQAGSKLDHDAVALEEIQRGA